MPRATVPTTGIEIEYETFGSPDDPALLMVMGFTAQLIVWPEGFCKMFADAGLFVIRYDNRDCGLSTKLDGVSVDPMAVIAAWASGQPTPAVPYTLSEMAADGIGLLDHLGIERAHVIGASMGGMIAQTLAIEYPSRCQSLISVMSAVGEAGNGQSTPEAAAVLLAPPPFDRDGYIAAATNSMIWQSVKYRDADLAKANAAASYDRSFYPEGATRQLSAIYASGARTVGLSALKVPTLVIHGRDDTLITPSGGTRTAELIDGANLLLVADMGHDLPEQVWPVLVDAVVSHARRAG